MRAAARAIQIKTSCYKPLSLGDRFGSFVVFGMDREEDGPISLGGNVQYQYKVTNPNTSTVEQRRGHGRSPRRDRERPVDSAGRQRRPSRSTATLYGTTTNVATVTGDVAGDICEPGTDTVTVGVRAPMQGSFTCSEPINELTLIWNGSQIVDVKAWKGAPNGEHAAHIRSTTSTPGDAITVGGLRRDAPRSARSSTARAR